MRKIIIAILTKIIRLEHIIYCATNCKVELLLHKAYYKRKRERYEHYVKRIATPRYDW